MKTPNILYVKRNCLDDGPGIRTTVFFKGCPLSCVWCHNPESKKTAAEISHDRDKCIACGACIEKCARGAISPDIPHHIDRSACNLCFECIDSCPSMALTRLGEPMTVDQVFETVSKDLPFYKTSGGGLTLSGGEPTLFMDFCSRLLSRSAAAGIHTLLETCGLFDFDSFSSSMLPHLNKIYFDIKLMDGNRHLEYCGAANGTILENFEKLAAAAMKGGASVLPRVPLVPGITATDENLSAISTFLKNLGVNRVSLLPYNPTWTGKPALIGETPRFDCSEWMTQDDISRCRSHFSSFDIVAGDY